jgi:PKD repeat protein
MKVTATRTITVLGAAINPTISISPTKGYVGTGFTLFVTVPSNAIPPIGATIKWGDGTTSYATITIPGSTTNVGGKTYSAAGTYTITVDLSDAAGQTGSATTSVQVAAVLSATLTSDKTSGNVPLTVTFSGTISGGYTPYSWKLDFGDGSTPATGTGATVSASHTYDKPGTYTATLEATDALGSSYTTRLSIAAGAVDWKPLVLSTIATFGAITVLGLIAKKHK